MQTTRPRPGATSTATATTAEPPPPLSEEAYNHIPNPYVNSKLIHEKIQAIRSRSTLPIMPMNADRHKVDHSQPNNLYPCGFPYYVRGRDSLRSYIAHLFANRIAIYDGAMGTMVKQQVNEYHQLNRFDDNYNEKDQMELLYRGERFKDWPCSLAGRHDVLNITQPHIIESVSRQYLEIGGSDFIGTNTFCSTSIQLAEFGMEDYVYELNYAGARVARQICDEVTAKNPTTPRFVVGCIGPTNKNASRPTCPDDPTLRNVTFDQLVDSYFKQVLALIDGGSDALMVETIVDTLNAKAALYAISDFLNLASIDVPVFVSATIVDESGRIPSGQTAEAFYASVRHAKPICVGMNCSFGTRHMGPFLQKLSECAECFIHVYANAGFPSASGEYDDKPEDMAEQNKLFFENDWVNMAGGCCGSTPPHIKAIREIAELFLPRRLSHPKACRPSTAWLSGLKDLKVDQVDLHTNSLGLPLFDYRAVWNISHSIDLADGGDCTNSLDTALQMVAQGARVLEIHADGIEAMEAFVKTAITMPEIAEVPFMLNASTDICIAGLKCWQGKSIVKFPLSLASGGYEEKLFIDQVTIIKRHGAAILVTASLEKDANDATVSDSCLNLLNDILVRQVRFPREDVLIDAELFASIN